MGTRERPSDDPLGLGQFSLRAVRQGQLLVVDTREVLGDRSRFTQRAWARDARRRALPLERISDERVVRRCVAAQLLESASRRYAPKIKVTRTRRDKVRLTLSPAMLAAIRLLALGMRDLPAVQALLADPLPQDDSPAASPSASGSRNPKIRALSQLFATAYVNDVVTHADVLHALDLAVVYADLEVERRKEHPA